MKQFIVLKNLDFFCNEIFCLDREIKKHLKCKHFVEVFQLAKLVEIQILLKYVEFDFFPLNLTLEIAKFGRT